MDREGNETKTVPGRPRVDLTPRADAVTEERNDDASLTETRTVTNPMAGDTAATPARVAATGAVDRLERGMVVGRYVVLRKLGAGGMGVVYAAYDPELDRRIALKMLLPGADTTGGSEGRTRLLREAQALAKLNHPNVVAIHDVGEHDTSVWLAMEFVEGNTLRDWLDDRPHDWREIVDVMTRAARGLVAAHAKGLLHRDFKPDNVMVSTDGRVRVMDFGLARRNEMLDTSEHGEAPTERALELSLTQVGSVMGTPSYMAPEQHVGTRADSRTDQFAFCVTLWEALYGQRPFAGKTLAELSMNVVEGKLRQPPSGSKVPAWLRAVCERGLSHKPEQRFESMSDLLRGIEASRRRASSMRWLAAAGVVIALVGAGAGYQAHDHEQRVAACEAEGDVIAEVWNEDARSRVTKGLQDSGLSYADATIEKVLPWLDQRANEWRQASTEACMSATVDHSLGEAEYDKAFWCLEEQRRAFKGMVTSLESATKIGARGAVSLVARGLPPATCLDTKVLTNLPAPPAPDQRGEVSRTRIELFRGTDLAARGKHEEGLEVIRAAKERAEQIGWRPLVAEALRLEASQLERASRLEESEAVGIAGYSEAVKVGAWGSAADAAIKLCYSVGYARARPAEGKVWCMHAENAIAHAGDPMQLREARRLHHLGPVLDRAGDYQAAIEAFEQALAIQEAALGPDHPLVADELSALANATDSAGKHDEALPLYERAVRIQEETLGPEHPRLANTLNNMSTSLHVLGRLEETRAALERALEIWEKAYGPDAQPVAIGLNNLASVEVELENLDEARRKAQRSVDIKSKTVGPEHPSYALSLATLATTYKADENYDEALRLMEQALAIEEAKLGAEHPDLAVTMKELGELHVERGEPSKAMTYLERALAIVSAREGIKDVEPLVHFWIARALAAQGKDPDRALAEAQEALAGAKQVEGKAKKAIPDIEAWLAERG